MAQRVLIIAGMHRSATSLVTQWLYRCGLFIGTSLFPPGIGNVEGHFEDSDFLHIHQRFLLKRNCPETGFVDKPVTPLGLSEKEELEKLIKQKNDENEQWGWKEPRTCLFLDTYNELIPAAFYLFTVRDPFSTINSMLIREYRVHIRRFKTKKGLSYLKWVLFKKKNIEEIFKKQAEPFMKMWIYYYEQILNHASSLPENRYMFIRYSDLLQNDKDVFYHLKNEWKFLLNYIPFANVYKEELITKVNDIEPYIKDKDLILKARKIESELEQLICYKKKELDVSLV